MTRYLVEWLRSDPRCAACGGHSFVDRLASSPGPVAFFGELSPDERRQVLEAPVSNQPWSPDQALTMAPVWVERCESCRGTGRERLWRVECAAYLGDEAARNVVPHVAIDPHDPGYAARASARWPGHLHVLDGHPIETWAKGLARWGRMVSVRAALAAGWQAATASAQRSQHIVSTFLAGEAWAIDPTEANAMAWERAWSVATDDQAEPRWMLCAAAGRRDGWGTLCQVAIEASALVTSPEAVRAAIQDELVPWLLLQRDPIQERLERIGAQRA